MKINVSNNNFGITQGSLKAGVVYRDCNSQYVLACDEDYVVVLETGVLFGLSYSYSDEDRFVEVNAVLKVA